MDKFLKNALTDLPEFRLLDLKNLKAPPDGGAFSLLTQN